MVWCIIYADVVADVAGYSKEAMKQVTQYQTIDRYEKHTETEAIVNAKFQYVPLNI